MPTPAAAAGDDPARIRGDTLDAALGIVNRAMFNALQIVCIVALLKMLLQAHLDRRRRQRAVLILPIAMRRDVGRRATRARSRHRDLRDRAHPRGAAPLRSAPLALVATFYTFMTMGLFPLTVDVSRPYAGASVIVTLSIAAVAAYGFYASRRRRAAVRPGDSRRGRRLMAQEPQHQPPSPTPSEFRRHGHALVDWIADYFEHLETYPGARARQARRHHARSARPCAGRSRNRSMPIMADFERILDARASHNGTTRVPRVASRSPAAHPALLAEFLSAALNQQAMLWRTSPAATELEAVALGWLRRLVGLPDTFEGVIYDTASIGTLHALVAAREAAVSDVRARGLAARDDVPRIRVYCSDQTHSSIDKAVITTRLGHEALRRFRPTIGFGCGSTRSTRDPEGSPRRRAADRRCAQQSARRPPPASIRSARLPRSASASVCGFMSTPRTAAWPPCCRLTRTCSPGADRADSVIVNPHKWLFTPVDLSAFYCRRMDVISAAISLTPDYLRTREAGEVAGT